MRRRPQAAAGFTVEDVPVNESPAIPVAIVGMGCLFPKADNLQKYWSIVREGVDAITEVPATHWRPEDYFDPDPKAPDKVYAKRGGFLDPIDFAPLEYGIAPNDLEATDATQLLGLVAARQALEDAGYGADRAFDRSRVSVILGVTGTLELVIPLGARLGHPIWRRALREAGVPDDVASDVVARIADGYVGWQENSFPGLLGNVVAGRIANRLDLGGTNCVVDAACASSLGAVHLALLELAARRADVVVTGGMDTFNDVFMYTCFSKTPALSPTGNAKPFDGQADGTILGEGLGVVVLKRLADAERDGDKIYAVIRSIGASSDGKGNAIYAPSPAGQTRALRRAYELAEVTPDTIELVEAHGTGTKAGDVAEATALAETYRAARSNGAWCALGSVKSQIGHTKAAAGAAGLIKAALALHHKTLPPSIKVQKPIAPLASGGPLYLNAVKRPWLPNPSHPRRAAVSAFGFGGSNFHCVLEEHRPTKLAIDWDGSVEIVAFSAASLEDLRMQLQAWPATMAWKNAQRAAAASRSRFQATDEYRLMAVMEQARPGWQTLATDLARLLDKHGGDHIWSTPDGAYFGRGPADGKLAMLFPGQGSQYVGMLRDLACQFPTMLDALAEANEVFAEDREDGDDRLSDLIYPPAAFDEDERRRQEEALRATDVAQPALGAVSLGLLRTLAHFGVKPEMVAGHSHGELTALCAAERYDAATLFRLSRLRGRLMAQGNGERGAMLAVRAGLDQVRQVLAEEGIDLTVANKNSPTQVVLSGADAGVKRAEEALQRRGLHGKRLAVAAAFHSPYVADAGAPFLAAMAPCAFAPAKIPVFANSTGREYPADPVEARQLLASQLAQPVEFVDQIANMHANGARVFLEVGPGNKLTGLVADILKDKPRAVLAVDASAGKRSGVSDLARALAQLAALGRAVDLPRWEIAPGPAPVAKKPGLTVPICGANYVKPKPARPPRPAPSAKTVTPPSQEVSRPMNPTAPDVRLPPAPATPQPLATPPPAPPAPVANTPLVAQALEVTRANLAALQKLGEQTADLHRQFLAGQERAAHTFQALFAQQQALVQAALGMPVGMQPVMANAPALPAASPVRPPGESPSPGASHPSSPPTTLVLQAEKVPGGEVRAGSPSPQPSPAREEGEQAGLRPMGVAAPVGESSSSPPRKDTGSPGDGDRQRVQGVLVGIVAEKTGYPVEMLEPGMTLDSDLGIDSIKRVEILSALQEQLPNAPIIKPEHVGTLRTLDDIVGFLAGASVPATAVHRPASGASHDEVRRVLLNVVAEKTGYPPEMLELDMALDSDLGIDSIKRVEILSSLQEKLPKAPTVKPEHVGTLRTLREVADFLAAGAMDGPPTATAREAAVKPPAPPETKPPPLARYVVEATNLGEVPQRLPITIAEGSRAWITASGGALSRLVAQRMQALGLAAEVVPVDEALSRAVPDDLAGLVIVAPTDAADEGLLTNAFRLVQHVGPSLRRQAEKQGSFLATLSRLDGAFGLMSKFKNALAGGLAGLAKTVQLEWPAVHCKALDVASSLEDEEDAVLAIVEEILSHGPLELGLDGRHRRTLSLRRADLSPDADAIRLTDKDVVVVSGGARGVTAPVAHALAARGGPTLVLLGRSQLSDEEPAWLRPHADEASVKRALHAERAGLSPRQLDEECRRIMAAREIHANLAKMTQAGGKVEYHALDVRDADAVHSLLGDVRRRHGPITGLVHGAGVLADRRIEDKTLAQFEEVLATKVQGCRALLAATADDPVRFIALFSSSTGRFGRIGQVDYAIANEVLNKVAQSEMRRRPACRVVAINWGPWDGGMVTPGLKKLFASEGMQVIPEEAGADFCMRELGQPAGSPAEVVVVAGDLPAAVRDEEVSTHAEPVTRDDQAAANLKPSFERVTSLEEAPVLRDHVLDGRAVVPFVLSLEWLAHAAMHQHPGMWFRGWEDARVLKGIVLAAGEQVTLRALAGSVVKRGDGLIVATELETASDDGRPRRHVRANVLLGPSPLQREEPRLRLDLDAPGQRADRCYVDALFHGPELQGIRAIVGMGREGIVGEAATAPAPSQWLRRPLRNAWLADPLALDCAFQLMVLWGLEQRGMRSLPTALGSYRQFVKAFPRGEVRVLARLARDLGQRVLADVEFLDAAGMLVARLEGYECILDESLDRAYARRQLAPLEPVR